MEKAFAGSGLYNVVVRVQGKSAEDILALVYDEIRPIGGVKSSHTMFALEV